MTDKTTNAAAQITAWGTVALKLYKYCTTFLLAHTHRKKNKNVLYVAIKVLILLNLSPLVHDLIFCVKNWEGHMKYFSNIHQEVVISKRSKLNYLGYFSWNTTFS